MSDKTLDEQIAEKASKLAYHYTRISIITQELEALRNIQSLKDNPQPKQEPNQKSSFPNTFFI